MTSPSETSNAPRGAMRTDSEEQLRLFIETVADYAIFTVDVRNRITTWNTGVGHYETSCHDCRRAPVP